MDPDFAEPAYLEAVTDRAAARPPRLETPWFNGAQEVADLVRSLT